MRVQVRMIMREKMIYDIIAQHVFYQERKRVCADSLIRVCSMNLFILSSVSAKPTSCI